mgnify:CR=1 FL=1
MKMEEHVTMYFDLGLSNAEILAFLALAHRIVNFEAHSPTTEIAK